MNGEAAERRPSTAPAYDMPAREDLLSRLRFSPETGNIWLDSKRMFLLHVGAFGTLRRELIETMGMARARGILTRMGYQSGSRDAELAKKLRSELSYFERFAVGPQLHALEGIVKVEPVRVEIDVERGHHYGEFIWRESIEDEAHISAYGVGSEAVCWMQIGYACGYSSAFLGRAVLYREVACRATGESACRIIGKPVEEWDDAEEDLSYFKAQPFVNRTVVDLGAAKPRECGQSDDTTRLVTGRRQDARVLIGASAGFNIACHSISRVAGTDAPVLILGESGVGKEMFARALHSNSARADRAFIAVNCAAIPDQLIEAELFGVEKGAFTGAVASRPGRFERANGGTLFLDEVGSLSPGAQSKLLRVLQEGEIERVGDTRTREVNVRVVAATNENLRECIAAKTFREDLFYRLNVYPIEIPPLRERVEDITILIEYFLDRMSTRHRRKISGFTDRAIDALLAYSWPGNVRELENMIERAVILAPEGGAIDVSHFSELVSSARNTILLHPNTVGELSHSAGEACRGRIEAPRNGNHSDVHPASPASPREHAGQHALIREVLTRHRGNLSAAARELGITRAQIAYRSRKLGFDELCRRRS
ncbi:sigma 54-interacting transcriptional regulator [Panacagrimonas sp.]|uniref:sigma 54-interacting transcriptional regulator n=1 Tax=Panacagrimonas sp. TaxID=2480088 RepID=UPI003B51DA38